MSYKKVIAQKTGVPVGVMLVRLYTGGLAMIYRPVQFSGYSGWVNYNPTQEEIEEEFKYLSK